MPYGDFTYTPPKLPLLRWLVDPGRDVPPKIRSRMLGELFADPKVVMAGLINGLLVNSVAVYTNQGRIFLIFMFLDVTLVATRVAMNLFLIRAASLGRPTATDINLIVALAWCGLEGAMGFAAMLSGSRVLQVLSAITVMALTGPICARNYSAPRYAITLVCLCTLPLIAGAAFSHEPWLLLVIPQTPLFLFGCMMVIRRFHNLFTTALLAREESQQRAQRDPLTGLLNRFGLSEALAAQRDFAGRRVVLLYLDLDGFKQVNDTFGHEAGDAVLRVVADRLRSVTRAGDMVVRLGGDEFVIVAPDMMPADAELFSKSIIRRITDQPCQIGLSEPVRIGVSIGLACGPDDGNGVADLHRKADAALYDAKRSGRGVHRRFNEATQSLSACSGHDAKKMAK